MKDVVYLSFMSLTEKVEQDWYLAYLRDHGVAVEYWNIAGILFPGVTFQQSLERDYLKKINDYGALEAALAGRDSANTNFVVMFNYEGRFNRLFALLTRFNCTLCFFEWGNFPIKDRSSLADRICKLVRHPRKFAGSLKGRLRRIYAKQLKLVKPFDVVFAAGAASMEMHPQVSRRVAINLFDYDNFLLQRNKPGLLGDSKYAVFLDINLAFQSDLKVIGWDAIDPHVYLNSLNRCFRLLEVEYGVEVVIAAHPKADYDETSFEGRKIMKGHTPELVKGAEFVISHHSTSISYAVLNYKPLLFIYTADMKRAYRDTIVRWVHDFGEYLGQPVFNCDEMESGDRIEISKPELQRYDLYKYNYLTSRESEGRLNQEIVLAELTV